MRVKNAPINLHTQREFQQAPRCVYWIRYLPLRPELYYIQIKLFHSKSGCNMLSLARPWGGWVPACETFKSSCSDPLSLMGLKTPAPLVFKARFLGANISGPRFKSCGAQCEVQIVCFSGKSSGFLVPSFLCVSHSAKFGVYGKMCPSLSYSLWCGFLLICMMCTCCWASLYVLFRGNYSTGSSYIAILNLKKHSERTEIKQMEEKKTLKENVETMVIHQNWRKTLTKS